MRDRGRKCSRVCSEIGEGCGQANATHFIKKSQQCPDLGKQLRSSKENYLELETQIFLKKIKELNVTA